MKERSVRFGGPSEATNPVPLGVEAEYRSVKWRVSDQGESHERFRLIASASALGLQIVASVTRGGVQDGATLGGQSVTLESVPTLDCRHAMYGALAVVALYQMSNATRCVCRITQTITIPTPASFL